MPVLFSDINIGRHSITFTPNGGTATDVGYTEAGSTCTLKPKTVDRTVSDFGSTPFDIVTDGWDIQVKMLLLATTLANIAMALSSVVTTQVSPAHVSLDIDPTSGTSLAFGKLVLHPVKLASAVTRDITIHNAIVMPDASLGLVPNKDLTVGFTLKAGLYQDATTGKVKCFTFGDAATAVLF